MENKCENMTSNQQKIVDKIRHEKPTDNNQIYGIPVNEYRRLRQSSYEKLNDYVNKYKDYTSDDDDERYSKKNLDIA